MCMGMSPLLALPRKSRDLIYRFLWTDRDRVAAYWSQGKTGFLVYHSGVVLGEDKSVTPYSLMPLNRAG